MPPAAPAVRPRSPKNKTVPQKQNGPRSQPIPPVFEGSATVDRLTMTRTDARSADYFFSVFGVFVLAFGATFSLATTWVAVIWSPALV